MEDTAAVDVRLLGTGGADGWPRPGCTCASCGRIRAAGDARAPGRLLVDGVLEISPGRPPTVAGARVGGASADGGHRVEAVPGGWDITGPDGGRLLVAAVPGAVPQPAAGARAYDVALLDLLESPAQLGALRARGLVHAGTATAALYADHRVTSGAELARRCRIWGVTTPADGLVLAGPMAPADHTAPGPGRVLVLGGARSGKSREAELRMAGQPRVSYLAAGPYPAGWTGVDGSQDAEWAGRVAAHRARRPRWWQTVESLDIAGILRRESGAVLVDGIGTWLAAVMTESGAWADDPAADVPHAEERIAARTDELVAAWRATAAHVVAVSDQVGSGVVPATSAGRLFRDQLGWLNQRLAAESEQTVLLVAGKVTALSS
jgi:adenosylcobinamide kinase / adenosylcobinamide-phosphate guanylyltransferase